MVERSSDGATFAQRAQLGSGATSYLDGSLASGTTYYYRVYAYNSVGSSGVLERRVRPNAGFVARPSARSGTAPDGPDRAREPDTGRRSTVNGTLRSVTATKAQSYDVYLNGALVASKITSTTWRAGSLSGGATYSWMVVANNSVGSTSGPTWKFTTKATGKK